MLSTSHHHFHPDLYAAHQLFSNGHFPPPQYQMAHPGLDALAESSQYALQQLQQQQQQHAMNGGMNGQRPPLKDRQSFGASNMAPIGSLANGVRRDSTGGGMKGGRANSTSNGQAVRRRISRACDQCNQLRTKCDGKSPCQHCVEFGLTCEYVREKKKRGKASRKDIAAQQMAAAN
ncbi:MAG: Zn(II)2Cys6 transcription factor, partial [Rhodospirillales bacterium]|nr:Zn(II)2Cys6 transcription factor [Acetobacter sp.]